MSFLQANRIHSLVHSLLWMTVALFIAVVLPVKAVGATGEGEEYVLKLNGIDTYVRVEHDEALSITGDMTLEVLVYWDGSPGYQVIASKPNTANGTGWAFGIRDGQPEFHAIRAFTEQEDIDFWDTLTKEYIVKPLTSYTLEPHTWNHLAIIVKNTPGYSGSFQIYHNGTSDSNRFVENGEFLQSEDTPLLIGRKFESDPNSSFSGYIEYVRLWDTAFTMDTMKNWYSQKDVTGHPNLDHLVAYWDFTNGEGNFVSDISGNGHTGEIMNGAEWMKKEDLFSIGGLETALTTARQSLIDHPEGVNIGETPKSARMALQSAIDTAQDVFDNYEGMTQEEIDGVTEALLDAIELFLATVITPDNVVHFAGGSGTEEDPYLIQTPEQLHQIRGDLSAHYQLLNDIDLAGWSWEPIGTLTHPFTGGLDGNGHVIQNLTISLPDEQFVGLFGVITTNGTEAYIRNLGLETVNVLGKGNVGALAGHVTGQLNGSVKISNSYVSGGKVEAVIFEAGGLIGFFGSGHPNYELYLYDVFVNDVLVEASSLAGGIVGVYGGGHFSRGYVIGTVKATNNPDFGRSAGPIYSGFSVWEHEAKMTQLYWNVTCDGCSLSHNLFSEQLTLEQFTKRSSYGDLWDFRVTWLLHDDHDMLPVLQVFHPIKELEVSVERDSVREEGYFFPEETAQIEVTATYEGFAPFELTGMDDVIYVFNDVVNVSSDGVITALRPGEATIEVHVGTVVEVIELTVHQILPGAPRELKVPTTAVQGGAEVVLTWRAPDNWGIGEEPKYVVAFFDGTEWRPEVETTQTEFAITLPLEWNTADAKFRVRTETDRGSSDDVESDTFTIDSVPPSIDFVVSGSEEWIDEASTNVELYDNLSGIHVDQLRYLWSQDPNQPADDAAWEAFRPDETLTLDTDGKWYLHILAEDHAGHVAYARSAVFLVDGTAPTAPTIDVVDHDVTEWIATIPVVVNITPGEDGLGSGVQDTLYRTYIDMEGWSEWTSVGDQPVLVEANGITHLEAKTVDVAGNESTEVSIIIRIDREIPKSPHLNLSVDGWTSSSVIVWISSIYPPISGIQALEWTLDQATDTWSIYDPMTPIEIDSEGETTIYARVVSGVGTIGEISSAVVRIDRGKPNIETDIITLGDGEKYVSGSWTNQDVQVTAVIENKFSDILMQQVYVNMQAFTYQEPVIFSDDGKHTVSFVAVNEVFGMTQTDQVEIFIDKSIPGSPLIKTDAIEWTNEPVTVSIDHGMMTGLSGVLGTEYKIGQDGQWKMYDGPFLIDEDGEHYIYARTWNEAGSSTAEEDWAVAVVRIASSQPTITLDAVTADDRIYEPNTWTNQAVTVHVNVYADTDVPLDVQYTINSDDDWNDYLGPVTVDVSGIHTVRFRVEDAAGNTETASFELRIDKDEPTVTITPNGNDESELVVSTIAFVHDELSGVNAESLHYLWSLDGSQIAFGPEWHHFASGDTLTLKWQGGEWYLHIYAKDDVGNEIYFTSDAFSLRSLPPPDLTLTSNTADGGEYVPNTWSNQAVTIEVDLFTELGEPVIVQYSMDSGQTWAAHGGKIHIDAAGEYTVMIRAEDVAGNVVTKELDVKIDDEHPIVSLDPNGNTSSELEILTMIQIDDTLSGVDSESLHYLWASDRMPVAFGPEWQEFDNGDTLKLSGKDGEWYLHIYAKDAAGNEVIFISNRFLLHTPTPPDEDDEDEDEVPGPGDGDEGEDPGDDEDEVPGPGDGDEGEAPGDDEDEVPGPGDGDEGEVPGDDEDEVPGPGDGDEGEVPGEDEDEVPGPGDGDDGEAPGDDEDEVPGPGDGDEGEAPGDDDDKKVIPVPGRNDAGKYPDKDEEDEVPAPVGDGDAGEDPDVDDEDEVPASGVGDKDRDSDGGEAGTDHEDDSSDSIDEGTDPVDVTTPKPFTDTTGHWAASAIRQAANLQLVSGYPDGTFRPDQPITRAEFTVMLVNLLQLEATDTARMTFSDEDEIGDWAKQAVNLAVQAGIVSGYNDGSFRPHAFITREEMAMMIARALKVDMDENIQTAFGDDADISHWAKGAVEAIRELGIVTGRSNNHFAPKETATRAEAVTMLLRLFNQINHSMLK